MAYLRIKSKPLNGTIMAQPSKSIAHRAIICASLATGTTRIDNVVLSDDISATIGAVSQLGAEVKIEDSLKYSGRKLVTVNSNGRISSEEKVIDCKESGSTARFMMPITRLDNSSSTFIGCGRLVERPFDIYKNLFAEKGITYKDNEGKMPIFLSGKITPGTYNLSGDVSSQFISGLLFVLPLLEDDSEINITGDLQSLPYIQMTMEVLREFGITIKHEAGYRKITIPGNQKYKALSLYVVEGDWSQAAFFCVMGAISGNITLSGLNLDSCQGDKVIVDILREMGALPEISEEGIKFSRTKLSGITVDVSQCPDLVPAVSVAASVAEGTSSIVNGARLRIKESDRLMTTCRELNNLGADIIEKADGLIIKGKPRLTGGKAFGSGDHRIVMAVAAASVICSEDVEIEGYDAVKKSYPEFWEDFVLLGGEVEFYG
ncbi:MAG: 3-phosphoshikimate 1-carboxyvinyltransferase [Clostridiaceae bacterium]|nr:3-phosphoshikimate 1-carboxyvinyltransferase [Clostridiaceae bacterium]